MVVAALVVAIVGAATGLGSLFWQFTTWKRSGWDLNVVAYWDSRRQEITVEITNAGRQECVISRNKVLPRGHQQDASRVPKQNFPRLRPLERAARGQRRDSAHTIHTGYPKLVHARGMGLDRRKALQVREI